MPAHKTPVEYFRSKLENAINAARNRHNSGPHNALLTVVLRTLLQDFDRIFTLDTHPLDSLIAKHCYTDTSKCPMCNSQIRERQGKFGKFYGCSSYPQCKGSRRTDGKPGISKALHTFLTKKEEKVKKEERTSNNRFSHLEF